MRKMLALLAALTLVGCGASGGQAADEPRSSSTSSTTMSPTTTTSPPTTTTTIPKLQAIQEMGAEIDRSCSEAVQSLKDPTVRFDPAWAPYGDADEVRQRAEQCVKAKWDALKEKQRKEEEQRRAEEERRRAEEEAARGTVSQQNARQKAAEYLDYSAFSRSGLIHQLEYEGFSTADATFGVDALQVDWNDQAAKKAAEYLDYSAFSRSGLIDQLLYEGFTRSQAEYGVSTTGL